MNTSSSLDCPQCGKLLPKDAPAGLCPHCLMALNLKTGTSFTDPGADEPRAALPPEEIAPHFPQLEILECLGRGGMGVVYKARQKTLNRVVALKLLAPERVLDPQFAERFAREARALAALDHPNIVTVYDFGQAGEFYYLLMEYVDGVNLRHLLRTRQFTPEEALAIVPPICEALQFAHDRGIVHRDIKPENILLNKAGQVKIADFGIAKMLGTADHAAVESGKPENSTQVATGTPGYMAPEQKTAPQCVDNRADVYSLGVVFYEMLTGKLPGSPIEPPSKKVVIDVRLDEIVLRALKTNPELRFQQVSEVKTLVETIVNTPVATRAMQEERETQQTRGKDPGLFRIAMLFFAAVMLVSLATIFWTFVLQASRYSAQCVMNAEVLSATDADVSFRKAVNDAGFDAAVMRLLSVPNTTLFRIEAQGENPKEVAERANSVARKMEANLAKRPGANVTIVEPATPPQAPFAPRKAQRMFFLAVSVAPLFIAGVILLVLSCIRSPRSRTLTNMDPLVIPPMHKPPANGIAGSGEEILSSDTRHLNLLGILHYVGGGIMALISIISLAMSIRMVVNLREMQQEFRDLPIPLITLSMLLIPIVMILGEFVLASLLIATGRKLRRHRSRTFCLVVAVVECVLVPFGTILGVFTIVVLMRGSVIALFSPSTVRKASTR